MSCPTYQSYEVEGIMTPEIVLGPPGTGKTTAMIAIVEEEISYGVSPDEIGFISFTRRAAREAADRAKAKFNLTDHQLPYFRTIHSLCYHGLGMSRGDVMEGKKMVEFGDWLGVKVSESVSMEEGSTFGYSEADRALFMENLARVRCIPLRQQYDENCDGLSWIFVERIAKGLTEYKRAHDLLDYTDMLRQFIDRGSVPRLEVLVVDETQDLSMLQWLVVYALAAHARRVVIAGDDDQAIYRWAGAALEHFVALPGKVRVLDQSWRVPIEIQKISQRIISSVTQRREKIWKPRPVPGVVARVQTFDEIDLAGKEILVLGRNAFVLKPIMDSLHRDGLIYEWRGRSSVRSTVLEAVVAWEQLRAGKDISVEEALRVYNFMQSGPRVTRGYKTLPGMNKDDRVVMKDLRERGGLLTDAVWHEALDRIPKHESMYMLRARRRGESLLKTPRIKISTIHGSKGGESDHVILLRDMASRTFQEMRNLPEDEARVWYVGTTRTKAKLTIVAPRTNMQYPV